MKKALFVIAFLIFFLYFPKNAQASLVEVNEQGEVVLNVLSIDTPEILNLPKKSIEVTNVADETPPPDENISLKKENEKISLKVGSDELDVTNWDDDLIQIEEREDVKKLKISLVEDKFKIEQEGISALVEYPIKIDPKENKLAIETPTGEKFLGVLPYEAAQGILRTRLISKIKNNTLELIEDEKDITYLVKGEKIINVLNVYDFSFDVSAKVSASTGEVKNLDGPVWLKVFGFLFA
jgi:hypothetical protein